MVMPRLWTSTEVGPCPGSAGPFVLSIARHEVRPHLLSISLFLLPVRVHDISASVEEADNLTLLTMAH